jgi:predicted 3-demethylubiquinone-9 3-methyltransferase (glyoxalase superfamily)
MSTATPFLTFQPAKGHSAEAAMSFYLDLFDDGEVLTLHKHPAGSPGAGTVMLAEFTVAGLHIRCSDSYIEHEWDFTPATSLWLSCSSDDEQQRLLDAFSAGGRVHMPLDDYGFGRFAWVDDQFGVSWQLARD